MQRAVSWRAIRQGQIGRCFRNGDYAGRQSYVARKYPDPETLRIGISTEQIGVA